MVKFETKFDSKVADSVNKLAFKKLTPLFIIVSALLLILGVFGIIDNESVEDMGYSIFLIAFGVLFTPLVLILTKVFTKKMNKSMHIMSDDTLETFEFYDDYFIIRQVQNDDYEAYTKGKYNHFFKVIEDNDNYYLYINQASTHVVNKKALVEGSLQELNEIFIKNIPLTKLNLIPKDN